MNYIKENSKIWDTRSENDDKWSIPVTSEMVEQAREGKWSIVLTPTKSVPADWFPERLDNKRFYVWQAAEDSRDQYSRQRELM